MKSVLYALLGSALLLVAGCGSDSALPNPTGKGTLRAINAIGSSPQFAFLIEERSIGGPNFKEITTPTEFDDFSYVFNFETILAGDIEPTRVASQSVQIERDREYTFVITGDIRSPDILVWDTEEREFAEGGTVFELRLAHLADGFPTVDIYVAAEGVAPVLGEQLATLAFGELMPATDVEEGDYVVTITAAGDPTDVVFQSEAIGFGAGNAILAAAFAPTANDTDSLSVVGYTSAGALTVISQAGISPTARFTHAASDLDAVDIYTDADLTDQIVAGLTYQTVTAELPVTAGANMFGVTPAGDTGTTFASSEINNGLGSRGDFVLFGDAGVYSLSAFVVDRRSIETVALLTLFNASNITDNFLDVYVVDRGTTITEDSVPSIAAIIRGENSLPGLILEAGSYDIYLTLFAQSDEVLAGPFQLDVQLGDVAQLIAYPTADPNVLEIADITRP